MAIRYPVKVDDRVVVIRDKRGDEVAPGSSCDGRVTRIVSQHGDHMEIDVKLNSGPTVTTTNDHRNIRFHG